MKKLVENDYLIQERSSHDRRLTRVRLSASGLDLTARISELYSAQQRGAVRKFVGEEQLQTNQALMSLERYWSSQISYGPAFGMIGARGGSFRRWAGQGSIRRWPRLLHDVQLPLQRLHAMAQLAHLLVQPSPACR